MGHGASTVRDTLKPLVLSKELMEGSVRLADDPNFQLAFTDYIKSGTWLDCLAQLIPYSHFISIEEKDNLVRLREYNIDSEHLLSKDTSMKSNKSSVPTSRTLDSCSEWVMDNAYIDLYQNPECSCFSPEDLLVILFSILYPIYLSSHEYERFEKYGIEALRREENSSSLPMKPSDHLDTHLIQTNQSKRAQELLLGCAAYFDESMLQDHLQEATWLHRVCGIFHDFPMALCIVDTAKIGLPFVYVNRAFCQLTGYPEAELLGSHMSMLNGPHTEAAQLKVMHSSVHSTETVKFSISLQSKQKRPLFDLVAQKAVGSYSISAHFVKTKATQLESLNMVDDLLIVLSYLVKAPALPPKPSWLPAPILILGHSVANALTSPTSTRSTSSSGSRGSGPSGRRNNSVRSAASIGSVASNRVRTNSHDSAQDSYRSFRVGGIGSNRRHSKGDPATPSSAHSLGTIARLRSGSEGGPSAGRHVQVDDAAALEVSVSETTRDC